MPSETQPESAAIGAEFDTIVIGTGPAGEGAAMKLAKSGQRIAVVEAHDASGRLHPLGHDPQQGAATLDPDAGRLTRNPLFQHTRHQLEVEFPDLLRAADGHPRPGPHPVSLL